MNLNLNETMSAEALDYQDRQEWLSSLSFNELLAIKKEVEVQIQDQKSARVTELRALIAKNAADLGLSVEELLATPAPAPEPALGDLDKAPPVAKYRDPATGATWTGRGKPPGWMKAWIENGGDKEDLRIGAVKEAAEAEF